MNLHGRRRRTCRVFIETIMGVIIETLQETQFVAVLFRIVLAATCGALLGAERAKCNQAAGMRTYMVVCIGAAIVMLTSQHMAGEFQGGDPARLGAQVISGIGFLGAGSIITENRMKVRGLTTAAGLWASACIGLAIGIGFYSGGIIGTLAVYLTNSKLRAIAYHFSHEDSWFGIYIEVKKVEQLSQVYKMIRDAGGFIGDTEVNDSHKDGTCSAIVSAKMSRKYNPDDLLGLLKAQRFVKEVKYISFI